ncbi:response regulator [Natronorubrum aibiense]|uniref:Response regulator n=1 Tax=Natronorubrum aibiense TaxID=348826 RepID=A0A5P9P9H4_9EURY|nr:response regulator [Natronorubrum aibiense]QFU84754.1 response regulator [Natronorubrum aibiense]
MDSRPTSPPEAKILLVEDNPGDVRLIKGVFRDGQINNHLYTVTDGQEALDFIHREGDHKDAPRPDIILLDLNLPRVDGEDLLHKIKHHPELEQVPVIILSGLDEDLIESRDLDHDTDEDAVIEKPIDPGEFVEVICTFDNFRLSVVRTRDST